MPRDTDSCLAAGIGMGTSGGDSKFVVCARAAERSDLQRQGSGEGHPEARILLEADKAEGGGGWADGAACALLATPTPRWGSKRAREARNGRVRWGAYRQGARTGTARSRTACCICAKSLAARMPGGALRFGSRGARRNSVRCPRPHPGEKTNPCREAFAERKRATISTVMTARIELPWHLRWPRLSYALQARFAFTLP